jgi:hypothetical protein
MNTEKQTCTAEMQTWSIVTIVVAVGCAFLGLVLLLIRFNSTTKKVDPALRRKAERDAGKNYILKRICSAVNQGQTYADDEEYWKQTIADDLHHRTQDFIDGANEAVSYAYKTGERDDKYPLCT